MSDRIISRPFTKEGEETYDRIFRKEDITKEDIKEIRKIICKCSKVPKEIFGINEEDEDTRPG